MEQIPEEVSIGNLSIPLPSAREIIASRSDENGIPNLSDLATEVVNYLQPYFRQIGTSLGSVALSTVGILPIS